MTCVASRRLVPFALLALALATSSVGACGGTVADGWRSNYEHRDADAYGDDDDDTPDAGKKPARTPAVHRASAEPCDGTRANQEPSVPDAGLPDDYVRCRTNAECTQGRNGRCSGNPHDGWQCTYDQCTSDSDCAGGVCGCENGFRTDADVCLADVGCHVDADCGAGGYCSPTLGSCGNYAKFAGYFCHTPEDECVDDADCDGDSGSERGYCAYEKTVGHWKCSTSQCQG